MQVYGLAVSEQTTVEFTRKSTRKMGQFPGVTVALMVTAVLRATVLPLG
jgi:hypothetical protein